jgi:hypothetical protein
MGASRVSLEDPTPNPALGYMHDTYHRGFLDSSMVNYGKSTDGVEFGANTDIGRREKTLNLERRTSNLEL